VLRPPLDLLERDLLFKRISMEDRTGDVLLLDNGDQLSGRLFSDVRADEGGTEIDTIPWSVPRSTQPISIPMSRVVAMLFAGSSRENRLGDPRVLIGFSDGSRLYAERIVREKDGLRIGLIDGTEVRCERTLPASEGPWQDIVMLQPMASRAVYLSDLEPLGHKHVPLFDLDWPYFRDANVAGGKLRHGGLMFRKGIGMHSTSRLAFELTEPYKWFEADLAIDERAGREGSVVFRVYLQKEGSEWSKAYESSVVRGAEQIIAMRVDIRGAVRLALIVDAADRLQVWDHANWLNARLVK
jgi:hypothetical protein